MIFPYQEITYHITFFFFQFPRCIINIINNSEIPDPLYNTHTHTVHENIIVCLLNPFISFHHHCTEASHGRPPFLPPFLPPRLIPKNQTFHFPPSTSIYLFLEAMTKLTENFFLEITFIYIASFKLTIFRYILCYIQLF